MAASMNNMFCAAVERILNSWTVLKLAVDHGMGGPDSQAKAEWMVTAVDQWFKENANLEAYEVEEFLADILNHEFDTIADDGSLSQIASMICGFYKLCEDGKEERVRERLSQLPVAGTQNCVPSGDNSQEQDIEDDEGDDAGGGDDGGGDGDDGGGGGDDGGGGGTLSNNTQAVKETQDSNTMETDEDGWQVVRKGKRK